MIIILSHRVVELNSNSLVYMVDQTLIWWAGSWSVFITGLNTNTVFYLESILMKGIRVLHVLWVFQAAEVFFWHTVAPCFSWWKKNNNGNFSRFLHSQCRETGVVSSLLCCVWAKWILKTKSVKETAAQKRKRFRKRREKEFSVYITLK